MSRPLYTFIINTYHSEERPEQLENALKSVFDQTFQDFEVLLVENYKERLSPNDVKDGFEDLVELKEYLFSKRLEQAKYRKSEEWTIDDVDKVLKSLPNGKSRDYDDLLKAIANICRREGQREEGKMQFLELALRAS